MTNTFNTIFLRQTHKLKYDEANAADGNIQPGMLVMRDASGNCARHNVRGGTGIRQFAMEDDLQGLTVTDLYVASTPVRFRTAIAGTELMAVLHVGETIAVGDQLISYGDGTLCKAASNVLVNNVADSTAVTNLTAETTFSNGTAVIPKNTLAVGDTIRVRALVTFPATNSTDTATIKLKLGTNIIINTGALDVANGDTAVIDASIVIRSIGATGTFVGWGSYEIGTGGTATVKTGSIASTTIDTTVAENVTATCTWSVANAGDQAVLTAFTVEQSRSGASAQPNSPMIVGKAVAALDLSAAGTNDFIQIETM